MTAFQPFVMEEMMSRFEQRVEVNLSESGVHPMRLEELLGDDPAAVQALLSSDLNYPEVNGSQQLRETVAGLYDGAGPHGGAGPDNVLITVGAIEANFLAVTSLLEPRRRDRRDAAQLHADLGRRPEPRHGGEGLQPGGGRGLGAGPGRAGGGR